MYSQLSRPFFFFFLPRCDKDRWGGYLDDAPKNGGPNQDRTAYRIQGEDSIAYGKHEVVIIDDPVPEGGSNGVLEGKHAVQEPEHENAISHEEQERKRKYHLMRNNLVHRDRARNSEIARPPPKVEERVERSSERRPKVWSGVVKDGNLPSLRVNAFYLEGDKQVSGATANMATSPLGLRKAGNTKNRRAIALYSSSGRFFQTDCLCLAGPSLEKLVVT